MMTKRLRAAPWLVLVIALMLIAAACSSGSSDTTAAGGGGDTDTTAAGDGGGGDAALSGTVRVWTHQNNAFNDGLQVLADSFMAENPDVTIEFETFDYDTYIQSLQTALPAGTEADVLQMFGTWTCSYSDNLMPVPESVISLSEAQAEFFSAPIDGYTCDDTLYGFPQEFNIEYGATLVNTEIAEASGAATGGWADWDAFRADALKMTDNQGGTVLRAGYNFTGSDGLSYSFLSMLLQNGGNYLNEDGTAFTIDTPEARKGMELMMSFVDDGVIDPVLFNDEANWVGDCYFEEACAMGLVGPWVIADYAGDYPEVAAKTIYSPLPKINGSQDFVADSGWGLTVSNGTEVADAAWAFVDYVALNADNARQWNLASGTLPALKANTEGDSKATLIAEFPYFEPFLELLPYGHYVGTMPDRDLLFYDIIYPHVLNYLQGVESMDEALAAMEKEANESFG